MDTHRTFLCEKLEKFSGEIKIPEIDKNVKTNLKKAASYAEELECVHQLFEVLLFNLEQINDFCTMYYGDDVLRKKDGKGASLIEINALLINVISAGKALVDGMERFIKTEIGKQRFVEFKTAYISKKYDDVFSYRFLYSIRNYAQHGYLPVSRTFDGKFCFDLWQIKETQHIGFSQSMKDSMESVIQEITEKFNDEPRIAFTYTLDSYTLAVVELYYSFLKEIEADSGEQHDKVQMILKENPELILHEPKELEGAVVFDYDAETRGLHLLIIGEGLKNRLVELKKQAKEKLLFYKRNHLEGVGENRG